MIKLKSGKKIFDFISFRKHFNLLEMLPLAMQISKDKELFINDEESKNTQQILKEIIESKNQHFPIQIENGKALLIIGDNTYEITYSCSEILSKINFLNKDNVIALLLSELGCVAYDPVPGNNDNDSTENVAETRTAAQSELSTTPSLVDIENNNIIRIPLFDSTLCKKSGSLEVVSIRNNTLAGYTRVMIEDCDSNCLEYKIESGNCMHILRVNGAYVNKLPQLSISRNHANYMEYYRDDVNVKSVKIDDKGLALPFNTTNHHFKTLELTQICADERGGFIALVNGSIVTYSSDVQPDDVEDLMMDIPSDERIVMIQLVARQIYALSNKMKVYSNFPIYIADNSNIIWLDKNSNGEILTISRENFKQPTSVDKQTIGSITLSYNNGKIS